MKHEFQDIIELPSQGYTPAEIVDETGVSRATVYRWIEQHNASLSLNGQEEEDLVDEEETDDLFEEECEEEEEFEFEDEPEAETLSGLELKNKELNLKERQLENEERKELVKTEKLKREVLRDFKRVLGAIKADCQNMTWNGDDLRKVSLELESLEDKTHEALLSAQEETEDNSILTIIDLLKETFDISAGTKSLTLAFSDGQIKMLNFGLEIDDVADEDFDMNAFHYDLAHDSFTLLMERMITLQGENFDSTRAEQLLRWIRNVQEEITDESVFGEFKKEDKLLSTIEKGLREFPSQCQKAFWNERSFTLDPSVLEMYDEIVEAHEEAVAA